MSGDVAARKTHNFHFLSSLITIIGSLILCSLALHVFLVLLLYPDHHYTTKEHMYEPELSKVALHSNKWDFVE